MFCRGVLYLFDNLKKNFGFGCMRIKMDGDKVDYDEFNKMIDAFMDAGFKMRKSCGTKIY